MNTRVIIKDGNVGCSTFSVYLVLPKYPDGVQYLFTEPWMSRTRTALEVGQSAVWLSTGFETFAEHEFLGFREALPDWGNNAVEMGGKHWLGMHIFTTNPSPNDPDPSVCYWGDDPRDTKALAIAKPWVLFFKGTDDHSVFERFATREEAMEHSLIRTPVEWSGSVYMSYN